MSTQKLSKTDSPLTFSSPLLGLQLLEMTPEMKQYVCSENDENSTPRNAGISAYEPHSTIRAKKRAQFDRLRDEAAQRKREEHQAYLKAHIKRMHRELKQLRLALN